jgi:hypothetical protein
MKIASFIKEAIDVLQVRVYPMSLLPAFARQRSQQAIFCVYQ